MQDKITHLTSLWYDIVGNDHHKDRDCHWYINKTWSYGDAPIYNVEHYGYIYKDISKSFVKYQDAENYLIKELLKAISEEYNWNIEHQNEAEHYDLLNEELMQKIKDTLNDNK